MNRKELFTKICNRLDTDSATLSGMIISAIPGDEFFFGAYKLVYHGMDNTSGKLYRLSLYKNNILQTKVLADIG